MADVEQDADIPAEPAGSSSAAEAARRIGAHRATLALIGTAGGLAGWMLTDVLSDRFGSRWHLFASIAAASYFAAALGLAGQIRPRLALLAALPLAVIVALLSVVASLRFDRVGQFLDGPDKLLAALVLTMLPLPFLIAARVGRGWDDYPVLFLAAWNVVMRYAAAWLFAAVVWAVVWLSDLLLSLVGIGLIGDLAGEPVTIWLVTGTALGLGLAVVAELSDIVSPFLVLRLARLLLSPLLAVVAIFLAALPLRGLSGLFGDFSAAATLMTIALAGVSLVSVTADRGPEDEARSPLTRGAARGMALALPVLGALALWAVLLRIGDYGFTPERVAALVLAGVVLAYGLAYAGCAALAGTRWMAALRRANVLMATGLLAVAALWLTPVLNAEAIAARDQVARYRSGRMPAADLPLAEMQWDWGRPGARALARLEASGDAALAARIAALRAAPDRWQVDAIAPDGAAVTALLDLLPVRPEGRALPDWVAAGLRTWEVEQWTQACNRRDAEDRPGCVLVIGDFLASSPGDEAMLLTDGGGGRLDRMAFLSAGGEGQRGVPLLTGGLPEPSAPAVIGAILDGQFTLAPPDVTALKAGGADLILLP
ncbi:DUF4153 domain-containing protein [Frigidibacter oleivorans]|uniref:DUF4153 domain-containing protein n=1 Tax=Frigidibacter oleivorans TaxID=2487129 RepID=UPI000F8E4024|nr:DUF4153 domain-containing protein [Frigidibacter oleivorans]